MLKLRKALPEARFIHVIRDGRDVALSVNARLAKRKGKVPVPAERLAQRWVRQITGARADAEAIGDYIEVHYEDLVLDTEPTLRRVAEFIELEWDPVMLDYHKRAGERLAEMAREMPAGEDRPARSADERVRAHALTAEPPKAERVGVWRERMGDLDRAAFESVGGGLLAELGYEDDPSPR
jgi:hypothetical protein